jgi:chloramphenicol O-acetyltransferase type A
MEYIDMENWKRREHFNFFHSMDYPQYNVCVNIDITHFLDFVRGNQLSLYYSMIFAVTTVANECENFRYRIRDGRVILHEKTHPSFTDTTPGDDQFKMVTMDLSGDLIGFSDLARVASQNQKSYFPDATAGRRDDLIYITCLPWISFTSMSHTIRLNPDDAVPRISWGKYFRENDRVLLPFSVQVHHSFADGVHVGEYMNRLQKYLDEQ